MVEITDITKDNFKEVGFACVKNKKHPGFISKMNWLDEQFKLGFKTKIVKEDSQIVGFIEYVDSKYAYRPIVAENFYFIGCIWIYPSKFQKSGNGQKLVEKVIDDAKKENKSGVCVVTSKGGWISSPDLYLKMGFKEIATQGRFVLLSLKFDKKSEDPKFIENDLSKYKGLNLLYSHQCPMCQRFVDDIKNYLKEENIKINFIELKNYKDYQSAPCSVGNFSIIYDGKLLVDNPISLTRFKNIIGKLKN